MNEENKSKNVGIKILVIMIAKLIKTTIAAEIIAHNFAFESFFAFFFICVYS